MRLAALLLACGAAGPGTPAPSAPGPDVPAAGPAPAEAPAPTRDPAMAVLAERTCGKLTLRWEGTPPPPPNPPEYGTERLRARVAGGDWFELPGDLTFADWRLEVASPDCRWVLLLQDRFGPYHLVRVDGLEAYAAGRRAPDAIVEADHPTGLVHFDAAWLSATRYRFYAGGDPPLAIERDVP